MIAKIKPVNNICKAIKYCMKDGDASIIASNLLSNDSDYMSDEFKFASLIRKNMKNYIKHIILSAHPDDNISNNKFISIVRHYLKGMGYNCTENQYVCFRHFDKKHEHVHILISRINIRNGTVVSDSHDFERNLTLMREIEELFELTKLNNPPKAYGRQYAMKHREFSKFKRDGENYSPKLIAQVVDDIIFPGINFHLFECELKKREIDVKINRKNERKVGISFSYKSLNYTGFGIGTGYSLNALIYRGLIVENKYMISNADHLMPIKKLNIDDISKIMLGDLQLLSEKPLAFCDDFCHIVYYENHQSLIFSETDFGKFDPSLVAKYIIKLCQILGWQDINATLSHELKSQLDCEMVSECYYLNIQNTDSYLKSLKSGMGMSMD